MLICILGSIQSVGAEAGIKSHFLKAFGIGKNIRPETVDFTSLESIADTEWKDGE